MEHITPKKEHSPRNDSLFKTIDIFTATTNSPKAPNINDFCIIKPISRGAFGKVFLGYKNNDPLKMFAIKVMRKSEMINKNMVSQVVTERNALALSRSPFCVNLFYSLQSSSYIYLVMDYMIGGDLKSLLAMYGYFDEPAAKFYCAEIAMALQYLHKHGIVHRDIKPDNMLVAASGHVKLTDFGLSKIELERDLEMSDLINCSPNLHARTPGQLLSLTSHLSFGTIERKSIVNSYEMNIAMKTLSGKRCAGSDADISLNSKVMSDSRMSGILQFLSAEDITVSLPGLKHKQIDSNSSYFTCNSSTGNSIKSAYESCESNKSNKTSESICLDNNNYCSKKNSTDGKEQTSKLCESEYGNSFESSINTNRNYLKEVEDSGVSSRKSDNSNIHNDISSIEKENFSTIKDDYSCSDYSRSYNNTNESTNESSSPNRQLVISRSFKRPECFRGLKRKRQLTSRGDSVLASSDHDRSSASTGLTQEIDIMDLGSSTPKKRKSKMPLKSVLKVRSLSDDELPRPTDHLANLMFSTPVSSQKMPRREDGQLGKLKATRFALPSSVEQLHCKKGGGHISDGVISKSMQEIVMSPINALNNVDKTPKANQTPFRTPKSVRRCSIGTDERILGTPDYLAPELLLRKDQGPSVDWWALGVCLYEFMTGVPPFNDETPQKVFENILSKNIEWPLGDEALSPEAVVAVESLLTTDPLNRPKAVEVLQLKFFDSIDLNDMQNIVPPFVPNPDNPTDTGYFEARNIMQHLKLSSFDVDQ